MGAGWIAISEGGQPSNAARSPSRIKILICQLLCYFLHAALTMMFLRRQEEGMMLTKVSANYLGRRDCFVELGMPSVAGDWKAAISPWSIQPLFWVCDA